MIAYEYFILFYFLLVIFQSDNFLTYFKYIDTLNHIVKLNIYVFI